MVHPRLSSFVYACCDFCRHCNPKGKLNLFSRLLQMMIVNVHSAGKRNDFSIFLFPRSSTSLFLGISRGRNRYREKRRFCRASTKLELIFRMGIISGRYCSELFSILGKARTGLTYKLVNNSIHWFTIYVVLALALSLLTMTTLFDAMNNSS
jgi:hypothetical protein